MPWFCVYSRELIVRNDNNLNNWNTRQCLQQCLGTTTILKLRTMNNIYMESESNRTNVQDNIYQRKYYRIFLYTKRTYNTAILLDNSITLVILNFSLLPEITLQFKLQENISILQGTFVEEKITSCEQNLHNLWGLCRLVGVTWHVCLTWPVWYLVYTCLLYTSRCV